MRTLLLRRVATRGGLTHSPFAGAGTARASTTPRALPTLPSRTQVYTTRYKKGGAGLALFFWGGGGAQPTQHDYQDRGIFFFGLATRRKQTTTTTTIPNTTSSKFTSKCLRTTGPSSGSPASHHRCRCALTRLSTGLRKVPRAHDRRQSLRGRRPAMSSGTRRPQSKKSIRGPVMAFRGWSQRGFAGGDFAVFAAGLL